MPTPPRLNTKGDEGDGFPVIDRIEKSCLRWIRVRPVTSVTQTKTAAGEATIASDYCIGLFMTRPVDGDRDTDRKEVATEWQTRKQNVTSGNGDEPVVIEPGLAAKLTFEERECLDLE
jgi:hypothetical protein